MDDKELEALAQQLFALYDEALGYPYLIAWDALEPNQREAWIQVAEFVSARDGDIKEQAKYGTVPRDAVTKLLNESEQPDHR